MLRRLSDPYWFQAFGCVLGFDWHSSGLTTTVCGALKEGLRGTENELGKGATSRKTPADIVAACERTGRDPEPLIYASRISAKVDNSAVQDGYQLLPSRVRLHRAGAMVHLVAGHERRDLDGAALPLAFRQRQRSASAELASRKPEVTLLEMGRRHDVTLNDINPKYLQKILLRTYERAPADFESLLGIEGVGAKTLRALALTSELIYGTHASTKDPARYSFAHGGKDGTPFPVDRTTYDKTIEVMGKALNAAKIARNEKVAAFRRLAEFSG